ncbi:MAG: hypothetical protein OXU45_01590, partial [Candidatus Melainabacteria bacterium]|nr:hypothetical protein [Candidatus Melainabacteria bacterium]
YRMTIIVKGARRSWMVEIVNRGRDGSLQVKYVGADFLRRSKQRGAALGTTLRADQFYFAD